MVAVVGFFPGFQLLEVAVGLRLVLLVGVQGVGDFLQLVFIVVGGVDAVGFQLVYLPIFP